MEEMKMEDRICQALTRTENGDVISEGVFGYLNVKLIVDYDDYFGGTDFDSIRYNTDSHKVEVEGEDIETGALMFGELNEVYMAQAQDYIAQRYYLWAPDLLEQAIKCKAYSNPYSPTTTYN